VLFAAGLRRSASDPVFEMALGPPTVSFPSFAAMIFFVPMNALAAGQTRSCHPYNSKSGPRAAGYGFCSLRDVADVNFELRRNVVKKKLVFLITLAGIFSVYTPRVRAQAAASPQSNANAQAGIDQDIELLRKDIRSGRKQLIAANLKLTADQATRFWPVYDQYTAEQAKIGDQKTALIKEYADQWNSGTLNDEQASSLIKRSLAADEQLAQLRVKYVPIFSQAVPGKVVATFFQLDRRVQGLIDIQLASQIPLVQAQ